GEAEAEQGGSPGVASDAADIRYKILDKIEGHLEEVGVLSKGGKGGGRLAADFGSWWTSKADTDRAGAEAQVEVKNRYFDAMGPQQVGKIAAVTYVVGENCVVRVAGTRFNWDARSPNQTPIPERESLPDSMRERHMIPGSKVKLESWDGSSR